MRKKIIGVLKRIAFAALIFAAGIWVKYRFFCDVPLNPYQINRLISGEYTDMFPHNKIYFVIKKDTARVFFDGQKYDLNASVNLIAERGPGRGYFEISSFDASGRDSLKLRLKRLLQNGRTFFLYIKPGDFDMDLDNLLFKQFSKRRPAAHYLAYSYNGFVDEMTGQEGFRLIFPAVHAFLRTPRQMQAAASDPARFIAHGGGEIDGHTLTNSLEALDKNYGAGFRLFELDIRKTADGKYVAVHSWEEWAKAHGFEPDFVPDLEEFKRHKIKNLYTPLDMETINLWFDNHPDAVLVTDKLLFPKKFASKFTDRNRLMMEVFSWRAYHTVLDLGAIPVLNWHIFDTKKENEPAIRHLLRKHRVRYIAASKHMLSSHKNLFLGLQREGVKIYLFHIGPRESRHAFLHHLDYAYGMYADTWDFGAYRRDTVAKP